MTLEEAAANVGRSVDYVPSHRGGTVVDTGVITSVNEAYVFVRYGRQGYSAATEPGDLRLPRSPRGTTPPSGERK